MEVKPPGGPRPARPSKPVARPPFAPEADVRGIAVRVLRESTDRFVDEVIEKPRERLDPRDRAFLTTLVYGATRMRLTLDWLIDRHAKFVAEELRAN